MKKFCDMTDILVHVSNSAVIVHCWTAMGYSALILSEKVSLMMTSMSLSSQSDVEDIKLEYWLKRLKKFLHPLPLVLTLLCLFLLSGMVINSAILFKVPFCDLGESDGVVDLFWKIYFLPNLLRKCSVALRLNKMASPGLTCCDTWKDGIPVGNWLLLWVFSWNLWE